MTLRLLAGLILLLGLFVGPPASALSIQVSPGTLALSPGGPYSSARDQPVGTVIATASSTLTASGVSNLGCAVTALMLSGSAASGNTFTTGLAGLGVNLYYYNGATRTQITPGIQASITANLTGPGTITSIEAELVVTGQVGSGTLSSLPSVTVTYLAAGLGCGVVSLGVTTLTVTASNPAVSSLSCAVTTPSLSVTLPTVSAAQLAVAGATAGATGVRIGLNCPAAGANVYVTLTDATTPANRSNRLSLKPSATAGNVAIELLRSDGTSVSFGPDSAAAGTTNQWLVGSTGTVSGIPLTARYVATGAALAGSVSASATFTLSYQ